MSHTHEASDQGWNHRRPDLTLTDSQRNLTPQRSQLLPSLRLLLAQILFPGKRGVGTTRKDLLVLCRV